MYYRLLNCGFRLGVSGGSAIGVMPAPTGFNRVYAKVDGEFRPDKLWTAIKAGRSFATSGPMLWLEAEDAEIGDTLKLQPSDTKPSIQVKTRIRAIQPVESLEIVLDGHVILAKDLRGETKSPIDSELAAAVSIEKSGWIAARGLYRGPDGLLRQAHTSPIYIQIDDQAVRSSVDLRYMLRWIERLTSVAEEHPDWFPDEDSKQAVLDDYQRARDVLHGLLETANSL